MFLSARILDPIHYGTWHAIKDVINMIEQAADSAEDAAEVINILFPTLYYIFYYHLIQLMRCL